MKRILSLILILSLFALFVGCESNQPKLNQPVNFYYRLTQPRYGEENGLLAPQATEGEGRTDDPMALLNDYLRGPEEDGFESTFPASTKILSLSVEGDCAILTMNDSLARYSGIDLSVACACLSLTVMELLQVHTVSISCSNELLDGAAVITMDTSTLTLLDLYTPEST